MKDRNDELGKFETITTIVVNLGTIISWTITLVTALVLIAQPQPIVINGLFELGKPYTVTFLISVLFGYIQLLRHFWRRSRFQKSDTESSFGSYLYTSIAKFRRPIELIGFVIIFIAIFQVEPVGFFVILIIGFVFGLAAILSLAEDSPVTLKKVIWRLDDEFRKKWLKRIRNQLYDSGYVFTSDFNNFEIDLSVINWAIESYFDQYEFEQDLIFTRHSYTELLESKNFLELRFDHLPTRIKK
jgi:hypothetical protein